MKKVTADELKPCYEYRFYLSGGGRVLATVSRTDESYVYVTDGWPLDCALPDWDDETENPLEKASIECIYDEGDIFNDYVAQKFGYLKSE